MTGPQAVSSADGRYGWLFVFITFMLTGLGFGGVAMVAIMLKPLEAEFGWQRGEISLAYTVVTVSTALAGVGFGRLSDRYGPRLPAIFGAVVIAASLVLLSRLTGLWQLYLGYILFGAFGFGAFSVPLTAALTNWFTANRGLALGIATAGGAVGQGVVPFIARALITDFGWRASYLYLGIAYLVVALPLAFLVRNPRHPAAGSPCAAAAVAAARADEDGLILDYREALTWICTAVVFCCICMSVPLMHAAALASDAGLGPQQSAAVLAILMLAGAVGRIAIGRIADRVGALNAYMLASFWQTAVAYWFVTADGPISFYLLAAAFGFGFGGVMTCFLLTIRALVPGRIAGSSMGLVVLFGWVGMGLGAYFGGLFFDWTGDYRASFAMAAIAGVVNLAILSSLTVRLRGATTARAAALG
ncbi:MAG: MFS transporter [Hyphomicrobiales bacterium]|nr:MFS transporter [Hyphomicrobiales bacterium]